MKIFCCCSAFLREKNASSQRIQEADGCADQYACHDLQRRMADHLLQMHVLQERAFFSLTSIH